MKENLVVNKSIDFAIVIIQFCEELEKQRKYVIAKQLMRSGTSIGANVHEAQNAESRADFIHKLKIAAKEVEETKYWLILCNKSQGYHYDPMLKEQIDHLGRIIFKIISSSKKKQ